MRWKPSLSSLEESWGGANSPMDGIDSCSWGGSGSCLGLKNPVNFDGFDDLAGVFTTIGGAPFSALSVTCLVV